MGHLTPDERRAKLIEIDRELEHCKEEADEIMACSTLSVYQTGMAIPSYRRFTDEEIDVLDRCTKYLDMIQVWDGSELDPIRVKSGDWPAVRDVLTRKM